MTDYIPQIRGIVPNLISDVSADMYSRDYLLEQMYISKSDDTILIGLIRILD